MPAKAECPCGAELNTSLGRAAAVWAAIFRAMEELLGPLETQWRPSRIGLGRMCLVRRKGRTLLYLTPDKGRVWVAIILGDRACGLALSAPIPAAIKRMLAKATPYAEGRGIRYPVDSLRGVPVIIKLVRIKTTPR
jgi:hypothetical protein